MTRNRIRDSLSFFLFSGIAFAIFISALLFSEAATAKVPRSMTASQIVLKAVMQDIRTCDKATPYAYDTKTKTLTPVALHRIKGLKLKRIDHQTAFFQIDEMYEGMRATLLSVSLINNKGISTLFVSVAFTEKYERVRKQIEKSWSVQLIDSIRPGPEVVYDGQYAEMFVVNSSGTHGTVSVEKMPKDVYPHVALPDVSCSSFGN